MPDTQNNRVTLKEHIEARLTALEKATELAARNMETRLDTMNEFRAQLKDQAGTFLPRSEYVQSNDRMAEDIRSLRESRAEISGKASMSLVMLTMLISVVGLLIALAGLLQR